MYFGYDVYINLLMLHGIPAHVGISYEFDPSTHSEELGQLLQLLQLVLPLLSVGQVHVSSKPDAPPLSLTALVLPRGGGLGLS